MATALVILAWLLVSRWKRLYATPAAAIVAGLVIGFSGQAGALDWAAMTPSLVWTTPHFSIEAVVSLAAAAVHRDDGVAEPAGSRGAFGVSATSRRRAR